jgi:hypothetical protein
MTLPGVVSGSGAGASVEVVRGGRNVLTIHSAESYPELLVVRPGEWDLCLIVPKDGQTFVARGGEKVYAYETVDGGRAQGFELRPGDRATLVRSDLPFCFAEWRIERATRQQGE